jgi:hypothetical protein
LSSKRHCIQSIPDSKDQEIPEIADNAIPKIKDILKKYQIKEVENSNGIFDKINVTFFGGTERITQNWWQSKFVFKLEWDEGSSRYRVLHNKYWHRSSEYSVSDEDATKTVIAVIKEIKSMIDDETEFARLRTLSHEQQKNYMIRGL